MPAAEHRRVPLRAETHELRDARVVVVPPFAAGDRLDGFLQRHGGEPDRSRSEWQRLIGLQAVLLNGVPSKPSERVVNGDRVLIAGISHGPSLPPEDEVPFAVVFEDPSMIVVNKPAGVVVHPAPGNERGTLVNGLLARFPELRSPEADLRPGIVHRLDKDTSGLMVIGRTLEAVANLQRQMQSRSTEKRYLMLVRGGIEEEEGLIDRPIGRDPRNRQRMAVRSEGRGAQTHFWVRERLSGWTLLEAMLLTGRTHQLRVHFASIGHPVAGDTTYGAAAGLRGLQRQFLHSCFLRLRSPHDGLEHTFTSELPPDLAEVLRRLRGSVR
ncbi:MAG: RluA family pseudouridine synthase [Chloroflexi bacterium]|nr:RluA family pseudouridine synthase [Chloroflexota bacterium]MBV9895344.1 RluA family pseudouridine synthase [Chloroflexota bacterium]